MSTKPGWNPPKIAVHPHSHGARHSGSGSQGSDAGDRSFDTAGTDDDPSKPTTAFDHYAGHQSVMDWVDLHDPMAKAAAMDRYRSEFPGLPAAHRQAWEDRAKGLDFQPGYKDPSNGEAFARPVKGTPNALRTGNLGGGSSSEQVPGPTGAETALAAAPTYKPTFPIARPKAGAQPPQTPSASVDAQGTRHISTASGGTVDIPAEQPQSAPDETFGAQNGRRTGITVDGQEQVATGQDREGHTTFAPGRSAPLTLNPAAPSGPASPASPAAQSPAATPGSVALGNTGQPYNVDALTRGLIDDDHTEVAAAMAPTSVTDTPPPSAAAPSQAAPSAPNGMLTMAADAKRAPGTESETLKPTSSFSLASGQQQTVDKLTGALMEDDQPALAAAMSIPAPPAFAPPKSTSAQSGESLTAGVQPTSGSGDSLTAGLQPSGGAASGGPAKVNPGQPQPAAPAAPATPATPTAPAQPAAATSDPRNWLKDLHVRLASK